MDVIELMRKIYGKTSNTYFNLVSRALSELLEKKLVEVINPKEKNWQNLPEDKIRQRS